MGGIPILFGIGGAVLALLIGGLITGLCLWRWNHNRRRAEFIENTPKVKIRKLKDGYFKTEGTTVALDKLLVSPLTREKCVFYRFKVEEQHTRTVHSGGRGGGYRTETYWVTVIDDRRSIDTAIEDATGRAQVDLDAAETVLHLAGASSSGLFQGTSKELQRTLAKRYGYSTHGFLFPKTARYSEVLIREGDHLFVVGEVDTSAGEPLFTKGEEGLIVSDSDEAGTVSTYKTRGVWAMVGACVAGVITLIICGVILVVSIGFAVTANIHPGPGGPGPNQPGNPFNPGGGSEVTKQLETLRRSTGPARITAVTVFLSMKVEPGQPQAEVKKEMTQLLSSDPDPFVRGQAARVLAVWGDADSVGPLNNALNDRDDGVRLAARDALDALKRRQ